MSWKVALGQTPVANMERVALITVERTFCLRSDAHPERCVLVIHPDLSVPPAGWKERSETVAIVTLDGREFEAAAHISLSHFNIRDPDVESDRFVSGHDVPDGSKILVSHETRNALLPKTVA